MLRLCDVFVPVLVSVMVVQAFAVFFDSTACPIVIKYTPNKIIEAPKNQAKFNCSPNNTHPSNAFGISVGSSETHPYRKEEIESVVDDYSINGGR